MTAPLVRRYQDLSHRPSGGRVVGGSLSRGEALTTIMAQCEGAILVRIELRQGFVNSSDAKGHVHPEHESLGYVLSGRLRMRIGTDEYLLEPGSSWIHPKGIPHFTEALEDTSALEFHIPVRTDLLEL